MKLTHITMNAQQMLGTSCIREALLFAAETVRERELPLVSRG